MIKSPCTVNGFLGDLRTRLAVKGSEEIEKLKELKEANVGAERFDGHYYLWDHRFYSQMLLEKEKMVDQQKISEYFPLSSTIHKMLRLFESLFGLLFLKGTADKGECGIDGLANGLLWHEDVEMFRVWDDEAEGGEFVGYFYLDLYPRLGKFGHAANFNLQPGFRDASGNRRYPATALVCNFAKPTTAKPSLLKHEEVVMLFHELGHGIHDLVSTTQYSRFHGTMTVQDFCEAPSQMLENWCWAASPLRSLSQHYLTGDKIPEDVVRKLIQSKHVNSGLSYLRQLQVSIFDMAVHQPVSHDAIKALDTSELYNSLREEITQLEGPEMQGEYRYSWGHGEATFFHLMSDYDAGYYGYLTSQVYALDMFQEAFASDPMNAEEGRRYRYMVLEKGGSQPEMKTLIDFLGREPRTDAFYRELGLVD